MHSISAESQDYRYTALQVAVSKFGTPLNQLNAVDRAKAQDIAEKQYLIQSQILSTNEASQVAIPEERLEQEITTVISRYPSQQEFVEELESNDLTMELFEQSVARDLRVEAVMDLVAATVSPCTETDARIYYYLHQEKFKHPELRVARHILITINPEYPENSRPEAEKRAASIASRVQKKPGRFAEQAMKYSECPTAMNGGELGTLKRGVLFPTLDEELFSMKAGVVSDVIESPMGFHVLMCESIQQEGIMPVSQAIPAIIEKITEKNRKQQQRKWIKTICSED